HPTRRSRLARNMTDLLRYAATTESSIIEARAAKAGSHFPGIRRRANFANPANRPRCWKNTNAVIATKSTPMTIITVPATSSELRSVDRIRSSPTPDRTNINWVTTPMVVSTTTLAAACAPGTPRRWEAHTCDIAADAGDRQQRVDGVTDP